KTPLEFSRYYSSKNTNVYLKLENQQKMNSFKVRGAFSKLISLTEEEKNRGILAVSSGNHGASVSYASSLLGIKNSKVFIPRTTPQAKIDKIEYYGSEVVKVGETYDEAHNAAMLKMEKNNLTFIDPCSDDYVISGQGTIGLEIMKDNPDIDTIIVPLGGGGMITGISIAAKHIKPKVRIIGVQTEACPAMIKSLEDNTCYLEYPSTDTICDALIGGVGEIPYKMASDCIDEILEIKESTIKKAVGNLLVEEKIVSEPSGAIGISALMDYPDKFNGKNIAVVISGGNLDKWLMQEVLEEY
ncbi:MAG: threonine/serine dehydratase, partial [Bacillota bacterium]|nr:threonine/serine dehydratase [Bacillota bacterium]